MRAEWIHIDDDYWEDVLSSIIRQTKDCNKRLHMFQNMMKEEGLTTTDIDDVWGLMDTHTISVYADEQFYDYNDDEIDNNEDYTYYFFNIFTGEAVHITYKVRITCSGIVND